MELINLPPIMNENLTTIFNGALASGHFPRKLKSAIIHLIPKAGKTPDTPAHFRPLSLLEIPGKILERIINSILTDNIELMNCFNSTATIQVIV